MNFQLYFNNKKQSLENYLETLLVSAEPDTSVLQEAARYSVLNGGKQMRGVIALMLGELLNIKADFLPLAAGLELIHTYSLIHDDLPSMDNDDYRRGKLTNHKVYGEDMAILTGDYLVTLAYSIFSQELKGFNSRKVLECISYISQNIGIKGMVGGQVIDIKCTGKKIDLALLQKMHQYKTGKFFEAAFLAPVILVKGQKEWIPNFSIEKYAANLGLLFQIIDDLLDEIGNKEKLGKLTGSDKKLNKATYTSILGTEKTKEMAQALFDESLAMLPVIKNKKIKEMLHFFLEMVYNRDR